MKPDSLLGVWRGNVHHSNGWDMKITISVMQPFEIGAIFGIFEIPMIQCSGSLRLVRIQDETLELRAIRQQGDCADSESEWLKLLPDGTLSYTSKGKGWETNGILHRNS